MIIGSLRSVLNTMMRLRSTPSRDSAEFPFTRIVQLPLRRSLYQSWAGRLDCRQLNVCRAGSLYDPGNGASKITSSLILGCYEVVGCRAKPNRASGDF